MTRGRYVSALLARERRGAESRARRSIIDAAEGDRQPFGGFRDSASPLKEHRADRRRFYAPVKTAVVRRPT